eukprot:TRINITY_DN15566_c0_g1_i3.p1 TRINITY_DN15566_c0_g1~~TRINITY_DN15566_c0_g1_i3.p1  ORF type:complete len:718 (-),score=90.44 TRINITY_DN15566_c0_g1_i3:16-2169(-)
MAADSDLLPTIPLASLKDGRPPANILGSSVWMNESEEVKVVSDRAQLCDERLAAISKTPDVRRPVMQLCRRLAGGALRRCKRRGRVCLLCCLVMLLLVGCCTWLLFEELHRVEKCVLHVTWLHVLRICGQLVSMRIEFKSECPTMLVSVSLHELWAKDLGVLLLHENSIGPGRQQHEVGADLQVTDSTLIRSFIDTAIRGTAATEEIPGANVKGCVQFIHCWPFQRSLGSMFGDGGGGEAKGGNVADNATTTATKSESPKVQIQVRDGRLECSLNKSLVRSQIGMSIGEIALSIWDNATTNVGSLSLLLRGTGQEVSIRMQARIASQALEAFLISNEEQRITLQAQTDCELLRDIFTGQQLPSLASIPPCPEAGAAANCTSAMQTMQSISSNSTLTSLSLFPACDILQCSQSSFSNGNSSQQLKLNTVASSELKTRWYVHSASSSVSWKECDVLMDDPQESLSAHIGTANRSQKLSNSSSSSSNNNNNNNNSNKKNSSGTDNSSCASSQSAVSLYAYDAPFARCAREHQSIEIQFLLRSSTSLREASVFYALGHTMHELIGGKIVLQVSGTGVFFWVVEKFDFQLCEFVEGGCPIAAGLFMLKIPVNAVSRSAPRGRYKMNVEVLGRSLVTQLPRASCHCKVFAPGMGPGCSGSCCRFDFWQWEGGDGKDSECREMTSLESCNNKSNQLRQRYCEWSLPSVTALGIQTGCVVLFLEF